MNTVFYRSDIDGNLFHVVGEQPQHYAKALPVAIAWHTFDVRDLADAAGDTVQSVMTDVGEGVHWIHYRADVEPLNLLALRELSHLNGPLALWRVVTLTLDLAKQLQALHEAEVPQLLIHPSRVAQHRDHVVLLATLAGVLPPLPQALTTPAEGWLHYIAPEVLRTRGMQKALLVKGDTYSLGRTVEAMCVSSSREDGITEPFEVARRRVELLQPDSFGDLSVTFERLVPVIRAMCAPLPSDRSSLSDVLKMLEVLRRELAPEVIFGECRQQGLATARACHDDLKDAHAERVFGVTPRSLHLMAADVALMEMPPNCSSAILELEQAESAHEYEADVQYRMGRAYALWPTLPGHLELSAIAYKRAASRSGWKRDIVEEWTGVLRSSNNPVGALHDTEDVPLAAQPLSLVLLRGRCLFDSGEYEDAWREVAGAFPRLGFSQALFDLGTEIAQRLGPVPLAHWMNLHNDEPGMAGPLAIAWRLKGNQQLAERYLKAAKADRR